MYTPATSVADVRGETTRRLLDQIQVHPAFALYGSPGTTGNMICFGVTF